MGRQPNAPRHRHRATGPEAMRLRSAHPASPVQVHRGRGGSPDPHRPPSRTHASRAAAGTKRRGRLPRRFQAIFAIPTHPSILRTGRRTIPEPVPSRGGRDARTCPRTSAACSLHPAVNVVCREMRVLEDFVVTVSRNLDSSGSIDRTGSMDGGGRTKSGAGDSFAGAGSVARLDRRGDRSTRLSINPSVGRPAIERSSDQIDGSRLVGGRRRMARHIPGVSRQGSGRGRGSGPSSPARCR
jgi:hypothetical protein